MLERTYDGVQHAQVVLGKTSEQQDALASMVDQVLKNQTQALTGQEEMKNRLASVCNAFYSMLKAETTQCLRPRRRLTPLMELVSPMNLFVQTPITTQIFDVC